MAPISIVVKLKPLPMTRDGWDAWDRFFRVLDTHGKYIPLALYIFSQIAVDRKNLSHLSLIPQNVF